jgi:photosystem II stability/assembly factor-like uncharacterized protein
MLTAGNYGHILRSSDSGLNWTSCVEKTADDILAGHMNDSSNGWATGSPPVMWKTTTGGNTWNSASNVFDNSSLFRIFQMDSDTIFVSGVSDFIVSTDAGSSWENRYSVQNGYAIHFTDQNNGIVGGQYGVFKTTNGGFNWELLGGMGLGGIFDFQFITESTAFAAAGLSTILRTDDGGSYWQTAYSHGINNYLRALFFVDTVTGWAVGESYPTGEAVILATTNGGTNWFGQDSNLATALYDVYFWNPSVGVAVGEGGAILETSNGGTNWVQVSSPAQGDLYAIEPVGSGHVWLAGQWNTILTSNITPLPTATPATPTLTPTNTPTITPTPLGDSCEHPIIISNLPYTDNGQTIFRTDNYDESCPWASTAPDVVYRYAPATSQTVDISLCAGITDFNTKLYVYQDNCPDPGNAFACNEDACANPPYYEFSSISRLTGLNLIGGHVYYIVVDGWSSHSGHYTIEMITQGMPTSTPLPTVTPSPTPTQAGNPTVTPAIPPTGTPAPSGTPTHTGSPGSTATPSSPPTATSSPSCTPSATPTALLSATPAPSTVNADACAFIHGFCNPLIRCFSDSQPNSGDRVGSPY